MVYTDGGKVQPPLPPQITRKNHFRPIYLEPCQIRGRPFDSWGGGAMVFL